MVKSKMTRRRFLAVTAAATFCASPLVVSSKAMGRDGYVAPSGRLVTALIGAGNRAQDHVNSYTTNPNFQLIGLCDCFPTKAETTRDRVNTLYGNNDCIIFGEYEEALAREDVDMVSIATPDHWHTKLIVEACQAGKDVFSEKPLTLTLEENRYVVAAARKYNRVVSSGSQRVMEDYGYMAPIVASGCLGKVKEIFVRLGVAGIECRLPACPVPEGVNWDRWLGQAPWAPYHPDRCDGNYGGGWRNYREYCNGFLADWGAHKFAGALYAAGMDAEEPVKVLQPNSGENKTPFMTLLFANGVQLHHVLQTEAHDYPCDINLVGDEATFRHGEKPLKPLHAVDIRRYHNGTNNIMDDVAYAVKHRVRPFQDVLFGARAAAVCQLMNIGYWTGRDLVWDKDRLCFVGDEDATKYVRRVQREPYAIPRIEYTGSET